MAKDITTRIVNGVPTLVTTSDNIEDFQNLADTVVVGSAVCVSGESTVAPADQANGDIAIGLVFEITSPTTCRVITHGQFDGYPAVLVPGSVYFLGESGGLVDIAPQSGTQQMIGFAVSPAGLFVHPDVSAILRCVAGGTPSLDSDGKLAQLPSASAAIPGPGRIPVADANGRLDSWVSGHAWHGKLMVTLGFGEPQFAHFALQNTAMTVAGPTPAGLTASIGRLQYFLPAVSIVVNRIRWHGVGTVANVYKLALYRADTGVRVWTADVSTTSGTWSSTTTGLPITIEGGVPYWVGISSNTSTGTVAGFRSLARPVSSSLGVTNLPGNLSFYGGARYAQIAVTAGVWPATLPALSAANFATTGTTGTVPMLWLDNNPA